MKNNSPATYEMFLGKTAENIANYLCPYVTDIEKEYNWQFKAEKIPTVIQYDFSCLPSWYQKTVKLKELLVEKLNAYETFDQRYPLGEYFVVIWGGVGTNKKLRELLKIYDENQDISSIKTLDGVSSWSKYLSLRNPKASIYDSRVAYAINTINYLKGDTDYFFPMPDGRSPKLSLLDIETLFLVSKLNSDKEFITSEDKKHRQISSRVKKKYYLPESRTYLEYLNLLKKTADIIGIGKNETFKVEMLLFALAPGAIFESLIEKQSGI